MTFSTAGFTSDETNLSLVCDENLGSGTLTESTAVKPSRASSPLVAILYFFAKIAKEYNTQGFRITNTETQNKRKRRKDGIG